MLLQQQEQQAPQDGFIDPTKQFAPEPVEEAKEEEEEEKITQTKTLWKPVSDKGGLAILYPYKNAAPVRIYDQENKLLSVGTSSGPSNGYGDTVRFAEQGSAFNNVNVTDATGRTFFIKSGSQRKKF